MERLQPAPARWRTFAYLVSLLLIIMAWLTGAVFKGMAMDWGTVRSAYWLLAIVGLLGYAYGWRLVSVRFWRVYAILFTAEIGLRCLPYAAVVLARLIGWPEHSRHSTFTILFLLGCIALTCVALLRHAELIGPFRSGGGPKYSEVFA
jgi:hypothetical protein